MLMFMFFGQYKLLYLIISCSRIQTFQRKWDILAVLIMFDARGAENSGPGYRHPDREPDSYEEFPIVVGCPSVRVS